MDKLVHDATRVITFNSYSRNHQFHLFPRFRTQFNVLHKASKNKDIEQNKDKVEKSLAKR